MKNKSGSSHRGIGGAASRRRKAVRVKTAGSRNLSSSLWLKRQLNDPYVHAAKEEGFRSRAAYKLTQLDEKFKLLKPGARVVDLGAAPGGWTQVAARKIFQPRGHNDHCVPKCKGKLIALDILKMEPVPGAEIIHLDFNDEAAPGQIKKLLGGPADLVLSDMAAPTTGHQSTDHLRITALAELAYAFAIEVLAPGGAFVCKLFQGGATGDLMSALRRDFASLKHAKPDASRKDSSETYLVAQGFRKVSR